MAVSSITTNYSGLGTGASATYGTGIYANASDQIKVYENGVLQSIGGDYSLNNVGNSAGVDVIGTFLAGATVYVERVTPITQLVDTQNNETILEDVLDAEFDKLTMIAQELSTRIDRAVFIAGAGSSGSAGIGFLNEGTGAVARTVQDKLRELKSVKDFGCKVDGVTDDTANFQKALDSGFDIMLYPGTMIIGAVTATIAGQRVFGSRACTVKHKAGVTTNLITITGARQTWTGFTLDGNSGATGYSYNSGEFLVFGADCEVSNIRMTNVQSHGIRGVDGAARLRIMFNHIEGVGDFGIFVNNAGAVVDPEGGLCVGNTVINFGLQGGGGGATASVGIGIRSLNGGWRITLNNVKNTGVSTNDQLGIECWTNSNNSVVLGNVIDMSGANTGEFGLSVTGYGSLVCANLILGTSKYAIELIDRAVVCTANIVRSPVGAGISVNLNNAHTDPGDIISITGNTIENTTSLSGSFGGIVVAGNTGVDPIAITITGNTIHGLSNGIVVTNLVVGYTISGNTVYNTGSQMTLIVALGSDGSVTGNTLVRVAAAGTGGATPISVSGAGVLIGMNRIAGNSRVDNAILVNSTASNVLIAPNLISGCTNAVFSNSTAADIVVMGGAGTSGLALQTQNYAEGWFNTTNKATFSQGVTTMLGVFTVANLPIASVQAGTLAYASNGRKNGEGAGSGTGVLCFRDGTQWRACDTGATVAA